MAAIPPPLDAVMPLYKRQLTASVTSADCVRAARPESFHSVSYGHNNIHECVLQGDYECDSDAVDVSSRRGISGYFTTGKKRNKGSGFCSLRLKNKQVPLLTEKKRDLLYFFIKKHFIKTKCLFTVQEIRVLLEKT